MTDSIFRPIPASWSERFTWLAFGLGLLLRMLLWWQDRSVFIDEANLIRNFVERPYWGFFSPLDYHQYAPPLFCMAEKGMLSLFGVSGRIARLLPLLAGCGALWLFYRVSSRLLSPLSLTFGMLFLALGEPFFRYATEAKQYSIDLLTTLLFLALVLRPGHALPDTRRWWILGAGGMAAIWFSMPSVFVLAGTGAYLLVLTLRSGDKRPLVPLLGCGIGWLIAFALYYGLVLRIDIDAPGLQPAHIFFDFPGMNGANWSTLLHRVRALGTTAVGFVFFSDLVFWMGLAGFFYALWRSPRVEWLLLMTPIALCLAASSLHLYPVTERLTLFFMPLLLILLGIGWDNLMRPGKSWLPPLLILAVGLAALSRNPLVFLAKPFEVVEVRQALDFMRRQASGTDQLYANPDTGPGTWYYTRLADRPISLANLTISGGNAPDELRTLHQEFPGSRLWILWNTEEKVPVQTLFAGKRRLEQQIDFPGCRLYLVSESR